ncbi:hypothetical protein QJS10_CPA02g01441 [Acorus calamus]|uniref:Transmembrane protein n=1 Tax=Acorus calamus TaxID=4465 RepID=A0AAV9FCA9_ACOCL|nr:hypothetical protein QJS10_CPA02g01441 [Acorus calamus]
MDTLGIVRDSLSIPITKKWKLILPITLTILISTPLSFSQHLFHLPPPLKALLWLTNFSASWLSTMAIIHACATPNSSSLSDIFSSISRRFKGPLITQIYVDILIVGYTRFVIHSFDLSNGSVFLIIFTDWLFLVAELLYVYLTMLWTVGLIASVLEDDGCYGLEALGRAGELIKGRKIQGFSIAAIVRVIALLVSLACALALRFVGLNNADVGIGVWVAIGIGFSSLDCLVGMFAVMVYTGLYFECKKGRGGEDHVIVGGGEGGYVSVPSSPPAYAAVEALA